MKDMYEVDGGKCIGYTMTGDLADWGPGTLITSIRTYPTYRNQGLAKKVLRQILDDADREDVALYLSPQAEPWDNRMHPGLSQEQLVAWYRHHGFEFMFDDGDPAMRRYPRERRVDRSPDTRG